MIKKTIVFLLTVVMCINLTACGGSSERDDSGNMFEKHDDKDSSSLFDDEDSSSFLGDSDSGDRTSKLDANSDGVVSYQELSLEKIGAQCSGCETALSTYSTMMETAYEKYCDEDSWYEDCVTLKEYGNQIFDSMNHSCSADVIYVEDAPYSICGSYGLYTGDWKGAGPTGNGSYTGTDVWKGDIVTYDGEWVNGLPQGYGRLYIGNFLGHYWDMDYCGYMNKGMRHGYGVMLESGYGNALESGGFKYRIYEETEFEYDIMIQETAYEEYYDGVLDSYGTMKGSEDGWVYQTELHYADELSDSEILAYAIGITAISVAVFAIVDYDSAEYETPYEYTAEGLDEWRTNKEAERQAEAQRQADEEEKNRAWHEAQYYECIDSGDTWSLDYQRHKYMSGN